MNILQHFSKALAAILLLFVSLSSSAQQEKNISSEIKEVKMYFSGAEVTRTAKTPLTKGTTLLIFDNIADEVETSGIQVAAGNNVEILSVTHFLNQQNKIPENQITRKLDDSLKLMRDLTQTISVKNQVLKVEEQILRNNQSASGTNNGVNTAELLKILELNRKRQYEIQIETYQNNKELGEYNKIINDLNQKLAAERQKLPSTRGEIRVLVSADNAITANFQISYLAKVAGWIPLYDIHTQGAGKPAKLVYKAEVAQNTGEVWENVKLKLSSANPLSGITLPKLDPEFLGFEPPIRRANAMYKKDQRLSYENMPSPAQDAMIVRGNRADADDVFIDGVKVKSEAKTLGIDAITTESIFEFDIPAAYSVPKDGKGRIVSIKDYALTMHYEYLSIPKLDPSVYLTGIATDWQKLNILPGYANMFLANNYTGKVFVNPDPSEDSLRFSFGKDPRVIVSHTLLKDFSKRSFLGSTKKETYLYEITLNNTQASEINMRIFDRIPISKNSEIKVEIDELSKGTHNAETGLVEWSFALKPAEVKKIKLQYTVVSPKNKTVFRR